MRRLTMFMSSAVLAAMNGLPAMAAAPPPAVQDMIIEAARSDDPTVFAAIIAVAKRAYPDSDAEIEALAKVVADHEAAERLASAPPPLPPPSPSGAPPPSPPVKWKATAELGGSHATGKKDVLALYGSLDLSRIGPTWTHRLTVRDDFQRTDGSTTVERFAAAYEPRVQIAPSVYGFGLTQYEHDRSLGYTDRFTLGAGVGVKLIDRPELSVGGDLGPALRHTSYYLLDTEQTLAGRASVNIRWLPSDRITVAQEAALYVESEQSSARSVTSLETLLFGPLKARLSYNLQYERDARVPRSARDTITRASILYSF